MESLGVSVVQQRLESEIFCLCLSDLMQNLVQEQLFLIF